MKELRIEQFVREKFEEPGYEDYYLLEVKHNTANNKVEVFLDSDSGLSLGATSKINRYLQERIDEEGFLGEKYILDVSSPGIGKPLKLPRQFTKNIGRTLEVTTVTEGKNLREKGILINVSDKGISIQYDTKEKQGKKKIVKTIVKEIAFDAIEKAVVKVSFKK